MKTTTIALAGAPLLAAAHAAFAQSSRPIHVLVPSAPGGPSDVQARRLTPRMMEALGAAIVVDNRASNNGVRGYRHRRESRARRLYLRSRQQRNSRRQRGALSKGFLPYASRLLHSPEVAARSAKLRLVVVGSTPWPFDQVMKTDVGKFRKVIFESGIPRL